MTRSVTIGDVYNTIQDGFCAIDSLCLLVEAADIVYALENIIINGNILHSFRFSSYTSNWSELSD